MTFSKAIKCKAYFKRFQTKYRRRREGKTDYRARKRLVVQPKDKYQSPRYRFVVRFTNRICICQIIYAEITGDKVLCSAYSSELGRYGLKVGLKNYCAAYCTGLLLARRLLQQLGMDEAYVGNEEVDGKIRSVKYGRRTLYIEDLDWETERRPFRANLDVGLVNCTTGHRVFGALKGASDGGLDIPHSNKRFPGYDRDSKKYENEEHRARIMGEHVGEYMESLQEKDQSEFERQFSKYIEADVEADGLEEMYEEVHAAIREDPSAQRKGWLKTGKMPKKAKRRSLQQRKGRVSQKKAWMAWKEDQESDDEE